MEDQRMETIRTAAQYIKSVIGDREPRLGIILGSGLGSLGGKVEDAVEIPYSSIPGFPVSTAVGHKGSFICGNLGGKCVLAMQGRFHYYEGYTMDQVTLPIRVMAYLGMKSLFVSNAAGGVREHFKIGDIMIITDHINLQPNPLIGKNMDEFGPRFPDMTVPYDKQYIALAKELGAALGIELKEGVYLSCTGPCYETPAEIRYMRTIGADTVGMSTTPEVIVARHCGMRVFGVSVVTDIALGNVREDYVTDENEIVAAADRASGKMTVLFEQMIKSI